MNDDLLADLKEWAESYDAVETGADGILYTAINRIEALDKRVAQLEKGFKDILSLDNADTLVRIIAKSCIVGAIDQDGKYCHVPENALAGEKKDG